MTFRRLSKDQLRELTARSTRAGICRWLRENGWIFEPDANGWPIVSERYAESRLAPGAAGEAKAATQPNFEALLRVA